MPAGKTDAQFLKRKVVHDLKKVVQKTSVSFGCTITFKCHYFALFNLSKKGMILFYQFQSINISAVTKFLKKIVNLKEKD